MTDDAEAERLARLFAEQDKLSRERLEAREKLSVRDEWLRASFDAQDDRPVAAHDDVSYALPGFATKILEPSALAEIIDLLAIVKRANDEMVGTRSTVAMILLADDEQVDAARRRLRQWADAYVAARLARPSSRDTRPVERFKRLLNELVPHLEQIAFARASVHSVFIGELTDYIPWAAFKATWAYRMEAESNLGLRSRFRVAGESPEEIEYGQGVAQLYAWERADDLTRVYGFFPTDEPEAKPRFSQLKASLSMLASDLAEMRPFLIRGHNPIKTAVELVPGLHVAWVWAGGRALGRLIVAESERELAESLHARRYRTMLRLGYDGLLASDATPWIVTTSRRQLALNLRILETIHGRLFSVYEKLDLDAIWKSARQVTASAPDVAGELTDQNVAVTCQLALDDEPDASATPADTKKPRIRTMRLERLLNVLGDRLGCEVRQGKGSEVVIFRPGGKIARLGRHTRNREVPSTLVRSVLERLGVTFGEWAAAIG
jgi:hypothetical protein